MRNRPRISNAFNLSDQVEDGQSFVHLDCVSPLGLFDSQVYCVESEKSSLLKNRQEGSVVTT